MQSVLRVNPIFSLNEENREWVVRIYQLTEGMPLGIELATAWVRALSCQEIAKEIENSLDFLKTSTRDIPERHRSLRTALDHSWNLLSAQEKKIFCEIVDYELNSPPETRKVVRNRSAKGHKFSRTANR